MDVKRIIDLDKETTRIRACDFVVILRFVRKDNYISSMGQ